MNRIRMFQPYVNDKARELVDETLQSGWIGEGPKVRQFETMLNDRFLFENCLALNSGTAALHLALVLAGVGPGDDVVTTAMTCTATNMPILQQYARPVFADIQYETGNIDPESLEAAITEKTKAIMLVHWAGYPADMNEISEISRRYKIPVIEDGAHALGATYKRRAIGTISRFTMFSFQAIKQLTTGDGGLLTFTDEDDYDSAYRRRWFGIDRKGRRVRQEDGYAYTDQHELGFKYHMNDIAASIGIGNMYDIDELLNRRHVIANRYRMHLSGVPGVTLFKKDRDRTSGDWLFTIHVERRGDFRRMMTEAGIDTTVAHVRNDSHQIFGGLRDNLPNLERYSKTNISIPLHNHLSDSDVDRVISAIKGGW